MGTPTNQIPELVELYNIMNKYAGKSGGMKFTRKMTIVPDDEFIHHDLSSVLLWLNENYPAFKMSILFSVEEVANSKLAAAYIKRIELQINYQTKTSFYQDHNLSDYKYRLTDFQADLLNYFLSKNSCLKKEMVKMLDVIKKNSIAKTISKSASLEEAVFQVNEMTENSQGMKL